MGPAQRPDARPIQSPVQTVPFPIIQPIRLTSVSATKINVTLASHQLPQKNGSRKIDLLHEFQTVCGFQPRDKIIRAPKQRSQWTNKASQCVCLVCHGNGPKSDRDDYKTYSIAVICMVSSSLQRTPEWGTNQRHVTTIMSSLQFRKSEYRIKCTVLCVVLSKAQNNAQTTTTVYIFGLE